MLRLVGIGAFGNMLSPSAIHLSKDNSPATFIRLYDRKRVSDDRQERRLQWIAHGASLVDNYEELIASDDFDGLVICAGKNGDDLQIFGQIMPLICQHFKGVEKPFILHHSTVSVDFVKTAYAACCCFNIPYANYPLTGGSKGAKAGTMLILASGEKLLYERVKPFLNAIGQPKYFDEEITTGAKVKLIGHLMVFNGLLGIASAVALQQNTIDLALGKQIEFFDFLNQGAGGTRQWDVTLRHALADNDWQSGFLLYHAIIDAIYTAQLAIESKIPSFAIYPILQLAAAFSYLLKNVHNDLATQSILNLLVKPSREYEEFIVGIQNTYAKTFLENIIDTLPMRLSNKVRLNLSMEDFIQGLE